jgi:D-glycero-D-manno-heptose 1,7-bisphosphate phosphatase
MTKRRALFLDRDGTLIHAVHYPSRPEQIRLYEDIGPELHALQEMGFCLVIITNQSGIARGYVTENDLRVMHEYLTEQLALQDIHVDGIYYCPHHPEGIIPELAIECACRKPQPGMLLQAAEEMNLDLERSWFVGDILDDVEAGNRAGCHTVLVDLETESRPTTILRCPDFVAPDTLRALQIIRKVSELEPTLDMLYCPASWRWGQSMEVDVCGTSA